MVFIALGSCYNLQNKFTSAIHIMKFALYLYQILFYAYQKLKQLFKKKFFINEIKKSHTLTLLKMVKGRSMLVPNNEYALLLVLP